MITDLIGEGSPDNSATAGTGEDAAQVLPPVEQISDQVVQPEVKDDSKVDDQSQSTDESIETLLAEQSDDTPLIKKLRDIAKGKFEDYQKQAPKNEQQQISPKQQEYIDLSEELFKFDPELLQPSTVGFVQKLASKDMNVARQAMLDLTNVPVQGKAEGWTLGHDLLEKIGLDPYKLPDLIKFSKGEITPESVGIKSVPEYIPEEYKEAYEKMSPVLRTDLDIYFGPSGTQEQKAAALQMLQDRQGRLNFDRQKIETEQQNKIDFENSVHTEVESQLNTAYIGLLEGIAKSPTFTGIKISSNEMIDSSVKSSLISQIAALGDPRSVLAQKAVQNFETLGVKIDTSKIEGLMKQIENYTRIAVKADKLSKQKGVDYSTQIQDVLDKRSDAIASTLGEANRIFSDSLQFLTGSKQPDPIGGLPNLQGMTPNGQGIPNGHKYKNEKEFDQYVSQIAANIAKDSQASG